MHVVKTLSLGVYVIGVTDRARVNAFTASSVMPVSLEPLLLAACVGRQHASCPMVLAHRVFSINVLRADQLDLARHFGTQSAHQHDKMGRYEWRAGVTGCPLLRDALAQFECKVSFTHTAGDHELLVGEVIYAQLVDASAQTLSYRDTGDLDGAEARYTCSLLQQASNLPLA